MRFFAWLDQRTGINGVLHETLYERVPGGSRWRYVWGSTLVFTFVLQVITGFALWMAYSPSTQTAWESVYFIENQMTLGWLIRGIHHFAAQAMVVLLALHLMQVVVDGAYKAPREINFWLGLILMQIVLGLALTGYLLPWDQKGYYATRVATNIAAATPFVGKEVQTLAQGGPEYGHHTLTRFFALHAGVLPALLVGFLALHIAVFRRHGITSPDPHRRADAGFWPDQVLKDSVACLAVLATVMGLAIWKGAELNPPADPAENFSAARPEWYFLFLFRFLKFHWVEELGLAFGAIYVPGAIMLVLVLMPILAYFRWGHAFNVGFMFVVIALSGWLTWLAWSEDSADENHQLALLNARRDGERILELADGPRKIPPDGALTLLRNDPFSQGPRLFAKHCASCHRWDGHDGRGKMVYESTPAMVELQTRLAEFGDDPSPEQRERKHAVEREIAELKAAGKDKQAALPTATDLADFGGRDWMRSIVVDYADHFSPLENAQWSQEFERAQAEWRELQAEAENGADDVAALSERLIAFGKKARRHVLAAEYAAAQSKLRMIEHRIGRLAARKSNLEHDARHGFEVEEELGLVDTRLEESRTEADDTQDELDKMQATLESESLGVEEFEQPAADEEALTAQLEAVASAMDEYTGYPATIIDLETSEMTDYVESNRDVLAQPENAGYLEGLVEYLVSLGDRRDLELDEKKIDLGEGVAMNGTVGVGELTGGCADCHDTLGEEFVLTGEGYGYPDLAGYASEGWLKAFLRDPGTPQFYGLKNHMPHYDQRLNDEELDLLVRWMLRDYPETEVEPYESKREELEAALAGRAKENE